MIFTCTVLHRVMWRVTVAALLFICPFVSAAQTSLVSARDLAAEAVDEGLSFRLTLRSQPRQLIFLEGQLAQ